MSWQPLRAFSMPIPDEWHPLDGRILFCTYDGIFQLQGQNELSFWPLKDIDNMAVNDSYCAFQSDERLLFGKLDHPPAPLMLPEDYFLSYLEAEHSVLYKKGRFYRLSHHTHKLEVLPRGCKFPKLRDGKVYWEVQGCFYCWDDGVVSLVAHTLRKAIDFAVGPGGRIAVELSDGYEFLQNGHGFFLEDVDDIRFDAEGECVILLKDEDAYRYSFAREEQALLEVGTVDELIDFIPEPAVLGEDEAYVFTEEFYREEPDGYGPEFSLGGCVSYNEDTICGLGSCLWGIEYDEDGNLAFSFLATLPYIDQIWKNSAGYLIESDDILYALNNEGAIEELLKLDAPIASIKEGTVLLENGDSYSMEDQFVETHSDRTLFGNMVFDGSLANWAWSEAGMWIDMQESP